MDFDVARYLLTEKEKESNAGDSQSKKTYKKELATSLLKDSNIGCKKSRILTFKEKAPVPRESFQSLFSECASTGPVHKSSKLRRYIPQSAETTLEVPDLVGDYYLNLLDWSISNAIALALGNAVYLGDATRSTYSELLTVDDDVGPITSVNWAKDGNRIAVGMKNSVVQLWDSSSNKQIRDLRGHNGRVGSLSWNDHILTTGSVDGLINNLDVCIRNSIVQTFRGHEAEVCGLKWSLSGQQLATRGDDDLLHIWDSSMSSSNGATQYLHKLDEVLCDKKKMSL